MRQNLLLTDISKSNTNTIPNISCSVEDTGKGIPKDKIKQVFERFQKLDEFAKGTGLGLAISLSIIKTFKGTILLDSEEGKGSQFTISLPYTPQ